ncbi:MAG: hypothetical protein WBW33_14915 [Bryobacteraceae bacterium]
MFPSDSNRSYLPLDNLVGFGTSDFIELALAALLVLFILGRARFYVPLQRLAAKTVPCMLLLAVLPAALRLMLIRNHTPPVPSGADDFGYLLLADTLAHFRLANPTHPLYPFFEQVFVLQQPTHSSIYPLGQGLVLAFGSLVLGHPWAGVLLSMAALCALTYWMLRAWVTPGWALLGGTLAVLQFGPLCSWTNCYWGGGVSAVAGCLVFGSLPRLRDTGRLRNAILLGCGLSLEWLTRPFEFILLGASVALFFLPGLLRHWRNLRPPLLKPLVTTILVLLPAFGLSLLQNKQVTGSWTTMPYQLSRYQYGVPTTFTFQPNPTPHRDLTAEESLDYAAQSAVHGDGVDTPARYLNRFVSRVRFYRFFFLVPLYFALPAFLRQLRQFRYTWVAVTLLLFALGTNFYPYFYPHYIAAVTCLFVLVAVVGLERLSGWQVRAWPAGQRIAFLLTGLCFAHFAFWYGLHLLASERVLLVVARYETWDFINYGDPEGRSMINRQLAEAPGKQLVVVRYGPRHGFHEWIQNRADINGARIVWARDFGEPGNEALRRYYPDRHVWLLEPDTWPPQLNPYPLPAPNPLRPAPDSHAPKPGTFPPGVNPFEPVH